MLLRASLMKKYWDAIMNVIILQGSFVNDGLASKWGYRTFCPINLFSPTNPVRRAPWNFNMEFFKWHTKLTSHGTIGQRNFIGIFFTSFRTYTHTHTHTHHSIIKVVPVTQIHNQQNMQGSSTFNNVQKLSQKKKDKLWLKNIYKRSQKVIFDVCH